MAEKLKASITKYRPCFYVWSVYGDSECSIAHTRISFSEQKAIKAIEKYLEKISLRKKRELFYNSYYRVNPTNKELEKL